MLLLVPRFSRAQEIEGGVQGGVTFSSLSNLRDAIDFGGPVDIESRTGVVIGPFVAFPINDSVAIQVEALYATKGATPTDGTNRVEIKFSYLDVPVLLRVAPTRLLYFLLGPSLNFNISAKAIDFVPSQVEDDVSDQTKNTEWGLVFAGGVSSGRFLIEGRYSAGLTDIADTPALTAAVRNRAFTILAGVRF
jgi:hypothetical protein